MAEAQSVAVARAVPARATPTEVGVVRVSAEVPVGLTITMRASLSSCRIDGHDGAPLPAGRGLTLRA